MTEPRRREPRERTGEIRRRLLGWYREERRDLPWRRTRDPYRILLSEAMLQQTRVETAIPFYERFLERWPTLAELARADEDDVLRAWAGLGYYTRARSLLAAARACVERHGGRVPRDEQDVRALPGVGPYTAGAVLSIAYGRALPAVDGNVVRVLSRLFRIEAEGLAARREVERRAAALVDPVAPGDWNQALMELGATMCTPRAPRCARCPVAALCQARAAGVAETLPRAARKRRAPEVPVAIAVCRRGPEILLVRRPARGLLARMWAPPCLEPAPAVAAEARAALEGALAVRTGSALAAWTHRFTHRTWRCAAFDCTLSGEIAGARWFTAGELDAVPTAFRPAIASPGGH